MILNAWDGFPVSEYPLNWVIGLADVEQQNLAACSARRQVQPGRCKIEGCNWEDGDNLGNKSARRVVEEADLLIEATAGQQVRRRRREPHRRDRGNVRIDKRRNRLRRVGVPDKDASVITAAGEHGLADIVEGDVPDGHVGLAVQSRVFQGRLERADACPCAHTMN